MSEFTDKDREILLKLARATIKSELFRNFKIERPEYISPALLKKCGCFVTLHKAGVLRGCIGTIEPVRSLISGVEANAIHAAFRDPRFPPLTAKELPEIEIEISVLTVPTVMDFVDAEDLKRKLKPGIHGVILSQGSSTATFLPQVWEQLPDKEVFLEHLCQKAGMIKNCWRDTNTTVKVYEVECFSEIK
ncbi:MAG: AmmeMemoRadiSam system protein A [Desulfobacterales bacterium]|nr:AmmeMemoRadiSam system protein A [Desulfobacterales bacterium]